MFTSLTSAPRISINERRFSHGVNTGTEGSGIVERSVFKLNGSLKKYPFESFVTMMILELSAVGTVYQSLSFAGIKFSSDFALAFAVSRPLKRIRLPVNLMFAAGLTRLFPSLTKVDIMALSGIFSDKDSTSTHDGGGNTKEQNQPRGEIHNNGVTGGGSWTQKTMERATALINKYGAAYYFGSRMAGVCSILGLYQCILWGMDLSWILEKFGVSESIGNALGTWAAAVTLASTIAPLNFVLLPILTPRMATLVQRFRKSLEDAKR